VASFNDKLSETTGKEYIDNIFNKQESVDYTMEEFNGWGVNLKFPDVKKEKSK